jgi:hypothetical protein
MPIRSIAIGTKKKFSRPTFAMRMETILDYVVSRVHVNPEQMEATNGSLLGVHLLHWLGGLCDGNNLVESKFWIYKVLRQKCTFGTKCIIPTSGHTAHLTFGG